MGKSKKEERYYQFPLCLLHMPRSGDHPGRSDQQHLAQHISSWALVVYGIERRRKLQRHFGKQREESDLFEGIEWCRAIEATDRLPSDFDENDWRHLAVFTANQERFELKLGSMRSTAAEYERVRRYLKEYRRIVGDGKDDMYARIRHDLLWDEINTSRWSLRQIRVLAGFYAALGGRHYWRIGLEWLRYLTAGYKSPEAYERVQEHYAGDGLDLNALGLPDPPDGSGIGVGRWGGSNNAKHNGFFRYDAARMYWQQHEAGVPFTGEGGMFDVLLTNCGAVFQLRSKYLPDDGSAPTTGRFRAEDVFEAGEKVVFDSGTGKHGHLVLGEVEHAEYNTLVIRAEGGKLYRDVTRVDARPAPARFFADVLNQANEQDHYGPELLTEDQIRYTRDKLLDLGLLYSYYNGRHRYYSKSMGRDEIAAKVVAKKKYRLKRQVEEERAKLEAEQEVSDLEAELAALKAATKKQRAGKASAGTSSAEASSATHDLFAPPALKKQKGQSRNGAT